MVMIELTDQDSKLFKKFREHQEPFKTMLDAGLFAVKGGHAEIHYSSDGLIMEIKVTTNPYKRSKTLDRVSK